MFGLLLLHVGGALKHQWIDRHAELARMGLGSVRPQ
jgi:cytochrome b561